MNGKHGELAEKQARAFLESRKLTTVTANYRTRFGEIDLVMRDDGTMVFVEVRYRSSKAFGGAVESVTLFKRAKIIRTAQIVLQTNHHKGPVRFDVVAFENASLQEPVWVKNTFEAEW